MDPWQDPSPAAAPGLKPGQACEFPWTPLPARAAAAQNSPIATAGPPTLSLVGTLPSSCQGCAQASHVAAPRSTNYLNQVRMSNLLHGHPPRSSTASSPAVGRRSPGCSAKHSKQAALAPAPARVHGLLRLPMWPSQSPVPGADRLSYPLHVIEPGQSAIARRGHDECCDLRRKCPQGTRPTKAADRHRVAAPRLHSKRADLPEQAAVWGPNPADLTICLLANPRSAS